MTKLNLQIGFFIILMTGVLVFSFFIFEPYLSALFLAVVLATVFSPVYQWLLNKNIGKNIAALSTVVAVVVTIFIPLVFFGALVFQEAQSAYTTLTQDTTVSGYFNEKLVAVKTQLNEIAPGLAIDVDVRSYAQQGLNAVTQNISSFFSGFLKVLFGLFIMIVALFFLLRDGKQFKETVVVLSPLADNYDEGILKRMAIAVNSVVRGSLVIAIIQGVLTGIGFLFFGVPSPALWGGVATLTALIPTLGTAVVIIPGVAFLYFGGQTAMAIGLLIWGVIIVGLIDNFLRPYLIERDIKIHPLVILLSVLGGIALLGPIGFVAGPVVISLLFALFDIYPRIVPQHPDR